MSNAKTYNLEKVIYDMQDHLNTIHKTDSLVITTNTECLEKNMDVIDVAYRDNNLRQIIMQCGTTVTAPEYQVVLPDDGEYVELIPLNDTALSSTGENTVTFAWHDVSWSLHKE